jgi:hypothetical protein
VHTRVLVSRGNVGYATSKPVEFRKKDGGAILLLVVVVCVGLSMEKPFGDLSIYQCTLKMCR